MLFDFTLIDEIPAVSLLMGGELDIPVRLKVCLQQVGEMIGRYKNHPAVVVWCIANEPMPKNPNLADEACGGEDDPAATPGKAMLDTMVACTREPDPTRLVTIVTGMGGPQSWMDKCDAI